MIGSLFSGIGGLDLACEAVFGMPVTWQCEANEFCRKILARHWPGVPCFEDVRSVDERAQRVEVLCGGFPCQDVSVAGARAGIDGERSGLWSEYVRIIRVLRPRYVVVENVPGLLTWLGHVLGPLAALGYDASWGVFGACCVGAPHRRERLFIVAADADGEREQQPAEGGHEEGLRASLVRPRDGTDAYGEGRAEGGLLAWRRHQEHAAAHHGGQPAAARAGAWVAEPDVGRVAHGVPRRVDRLRALGNAVVPQQAEAAIRTLLTSLR